MENQLKDIRRTLVLKAPIQKVWDAVATAEGLEAWFMPNDFKPEIGHEFHVDAGPYGMSPCKVTELDPPNLLAFDWAKDWKLTFELKDLGEETELTFVHSGWDDAKETEFGQPHSVVRGIMKEGWDGLLTRALTKYLEG